MLTTGQIHYCHRYCGRFASLRCSCGLWMCTSHRYLYGSSVYCGPCLRRLHQTARQQEKEVR